LRRTNEMMPNAKKERLCGRDKRRHLPSVEKARELAFPELRRAPQLPPAVVREFEVVKRLFWALRAQGKL
jgi:hypothetical protein